MADKFDLVADKARILLEQKKSKDVISIIKKAIGGLACPPSLALILAEAYLSVGMKTDATYLINDYIASNPKSIRVFKDVIEFYTKIKDYDNSHYYIDIAIKAFPLSGTFVTDKAITLLTQGKVEESASTLLKKLTFGKFADEDAPLIKDLRKSFKNYPQVIGTAYEFLSHPEINEIYLRSVFDRGISLGTDCEFGTVQRVMGKEPLDLLRWGTIPLDCLVELLRNRFSNFASAGSVSFDLSKDDNTGGWEYHFVDKIYGMEAHTLHYPFSMGIKVSEDEILEKMRQHFFMLSRKLQDDLEDAEKFFVYKSKQVLNIDECRGLLDALNLYGENKLLVVMPRNNTEDDFEMIESNLHIGRLKNFWRDAKIDDVQLEAWKSIISQSWGHFIEQYPYMDEVSI